MKILKSIADKMPIFIIERFERFVLSDYSKTKKFLNRVDPDVLENISRKKAFNIVKSAIGSVPAYKEFLNEKKFEFEKFRKPKDFDLIPGTDKKNYVKRFSFDSRCKGGYLPLHGNIDESGGTSGKATNWIHDVSEEDLLLKAVEFEFNYIFADKEKNKDFLVISAWSTGPWATGVKFCELMEKIALVKNTDTDTEDIISTLNMFGKDKTYIIGGYPPFIKNLIDDNKERIDWKDYKIHLITGGEGVTLEWVYYMKRLLWDKAKIISSYGASDIDIGIGFESPLCFLIREKIAKNSILQQELFGKEEVPMIFQYNPLMHHIVNKKSDVDKSKGKCEFEITLLDKNSALPKIKYNIHDEGKKFGFDEMMSILKRYEPNLLAALDKEDVLNLPFLCIFGRSDGTLSFDGANVFPAQIESAILKKKSLSKITNRFKMEKKYAKDYTVKFHVYFELKKGKKPGNQNLLKKKYLDAVLKELLAKNPDFNESYSKNKTLQPIINIYPFDHKLFSKDDCKVKNIYLKS